MKDQLIGYGITFGLAAIGGIWALVHLVWKLASSAQRIESKLEHAIPKIAKVEERVDEHDGEHRAHDNRITAIESTLNVGSEKIVTGRHSPFKGGKG